MRRRAFATSLAMMSDSQRVHIWVPSYCYAGLTIAVIVQRVVVRCRPRGLPAEI